MNWTQAFWKSILPVISPAYGAASLAAFVSKYFSGTGASQATPEDITNAAWAEYRSGRMTYQQLMETLAAVDRANQAAAGRSGLAQFGNILKWVAIIGGISLGAYLLAPTIKRAVALIPIPEPKAA